MIYSTMKIRSNWNTLILQDFQDQRKSGSPTFLVPLHGDPVSLEEALVGQRSSGSSQHRVLVQPDERRGSFTAWHIDDNLEGTNGTGWDQDQSQTRSASAAEGSWLLTLLG